MDRPEFGKPSCTCGRGPIDDDPSCPLHHAKAKPLTDAEKAAALDAFRQRDPFRHHDTELDGRLVSIDTETGEITELE